MRCKEVALSACPWRSARMLQARRQRRSMLRAGSQRNPGDFGAPERRVTDTLLVLNAAIYIAQLASKDQLTIWGIKARSRPAQYQCATQLAEVPTIRACRGARFHLA